MPERIVRKIPPKFVALPQIVRQVKVRKVAAYARVSTSSLEQENSLDAQCDYFLNLIQSHENWQFIDIYYDDIGERSYGRNKTIALAAMKELKKYPDLSREDTRLYFAKLNQAGAITVLDFLDEEQAAQLCKKLMEEVFEIPTLQDGCEFMLYDNLTGQAYADTLNLVKGKAVTTVKRKLFSEKQVEINTEPKILRGKREGSKVTIDGKKYVIKDIH